MSEESAEPDSSAAPLEILFQDDVCVAINKPPGLLVHRTSVASDASEFAVQLLRDQIQQKVFPVHRLDRPTSGVLLFALSSEAARTFAKQFESRAVQKIYTAFVRGHCLDSGVLDRPLCDVRDLRSETRKHETEREAVTEFRTISRFELPISDGRHQTSRYSLLELRPQTGRRHQIRRHLKHASHPIVGDTAHGDHRHNKRLASRYQLNRLLLAASSLRVAHPETGQPLELSCDLGVEFSRFLADMQPYRISG
ncbi:MAG: pseudouridine synthase [Planctomycetaceae bacterium]